MKPSDGEDELLQLYRQASDAKEPQPGPAVRRAVLAHANKVALEIRQGSGAVAATPASGNARPAANQPFFGWNARLLASVMVLGFAGLLAWQFDSQPDLQSERTRVPPRPDFVEQKAPRTVAPSAPPPRPLELAHGAGADSQAPGTVPASPTHMAGEAPGQRSNVATAAPRQESAAEADSGAGSAAGAAAPTQPAQASATSRALADNSAALVRPLAKATNGAPAAAPAVAAANAESRASALSPNQQLLQAAGVGDALRMEQLLASGAQVDARDDQGRTALMLAVQHRQHLAATKLIELGARRSLTDPQGLTALDMARALGDEALLRLLAPAQ